MHILTTMDAICLSLGDTATKFSRLQSAFFEQWWKYDMDGGRSDCGILCEEYVYVVLLLSGQLK